MAAEEQVIIVIRGKDAASKIFRTVGAEADKAGVKVEKGLGSKFKKVGEAAAKMGKALALGAAGGLVLFGKSAIDGAVKAERLQKTLDGLAGGAENAARYIASIKDASQGTIPQVEALAIANRALSFGVVKNTEEMDKLTRVAIALGRAQGLDATTAVSDLTTALSRNSPMILDNLGITLKLTEAYRIYADSVGKSADALTEEEKAMAFREAALIKGMEKVEQMGGLQDDMASSGERLKAQIADMSVELGQSLLPMVSMLVEKLTAAASAVAPLIQGFAEMVKTVDGVSEASDTMVNTLKSVSDETEMAGSIADQFAKKMSVTAKETSGLNDVILWLGNNSSILGNTASRADLLAAATDGLHDAAVGASSSYEDYLGVIDEYNSKIGDASLKTRAMTEEQFKARQAGGEWIASLIEQGRQMEMLAEDAARVDQNMFNLAQRTMEGRDTQKSYNEILAEGTEGFRRVEQAAAMAAEEWGGGAGELEAFRAKNAEAAAALDEWRAKAAESTAATAAHRAEVALAAQDYTNLAMSLQGATEAQLAQSLISMLDPEAMGAEAFTAAVTDIGMEFGLMDEKSAALAASLPKLAEAIEAGVIPAENASEALSAMAEDAEDGDVNIGSLIGTFDRFPASADPAITSAGDMASGLEDVDNAGTPTITMMDNLATSTQNVVGPMNEVTQAAAALERQLGALGAAGTGAAPPPPSGGGFQMGGRVPGPIGRPRMILAHGGEMVSNPYQYGAVGGPGGPPAPMNNYGGDTFNVNINDRMAAALFLDQMRRHRYDRMNARM